MLTPMANGHLNFCQFNLTLKVKDLLARFLFGAKSFQLEELHCRVYSHRKNSYRNHRWLEDLSDLTYWEQYHDLILKFEARGSLLQERNLLNQSL